MTKRLLLVGLLVLALIGTATHMATRDPDGPSRPDRPDDPTGDAEPPPAFGDPIPPAFIPTDVLPGASASAKKESAPGKPADPIAVAGAMVLEKLLPLLNEANDPAAFLDGTGSAPWELHDLPRPMIEKVIAALSSEDAKARLNAALVLSALNLLPEDLASIRSAFDDEMKGMNDRDTKNATLVLAFALSTHGDRHGMARLGDAVRNGSADDVDGFRRDVALVMAIAKDEGSSPLLRELLASDPDRAVRKNSAVGLGRIGGDENRTAIADALTREQDIEVRAWTALAAGRAAGRGGDDGALETAMNDDAAGEVRAAAAYALGTAGGQGTTAALIESYYGEDHSLARVGAIAGLVRRGGTGEKSTEFLANEGTSFLSKTVMEDPDSTSRYYAVTTLKTMPRSEKSSEALRHAVTSDRSSWVRRAAVETLAKKEGKDALPTLKAALAKEESKRVRREIERQIKRLKAALAKEESKRVRREIERQIKRLSK